KPKLPKADFLDLPIRLFPITRSRFTSWRFTIICRTGCAAVPECCSATLLKCLKTAVVRVGVIIDTPRSSIRGVRVRNQHHHRRTQNGCYHSHFGSPLTKVCRSSKSSFARHIASANSRIAFLCSRRP